MFLVAYLLWCAPLIGPLQTFLGLGLSLGSLGFGCLVVSRSKQCLVSPQYLLQTAILGIGEYLDYHCCPLYHRY